MSNFASARFTVSQLAVFGEDLYHNYIEQLAHCQQRIAQTLTVAERLKTRFSTKVFFWLFVTLAIMAIFLFWTAGGSANRGGGDKRKLFDMNMWLGIASGGMSIMFGMMCFIRFIRSRSITGGLFLTTSIATAAFLIVSQMLPVFIPPTAAAFAIDPLDAGNNGLQLMIVLAQIGLFALWFGFLLFTIFLYVQPVKRIDKYLTQVLRGEDIGRVKIGNARQYKALEVKIREIGDRKLRRRRRV